MGNRTICSSNGVDYNIFNIYWTTRVSGKLNVKWYGKYHLYLKIPPYYLEAAIRSGILQFRKINCKLNWSLLRKSKLFNISATKIRVLGSTR